MSRAPRPWTEAEKALLDGAAVDPTAGPRALADKLPGRSYSAVKMRLQDRRRALGLRPISATYGKARLPTTLSPDDPGLPDLATPIAAASAKRGSVLLLNAIRRHHPEQVRHELR